MPSGLEPVARAQLERLGLRQLTPAPGGFRTPLLDRPADLTSATTLHAVYLSLGFDVPRPKALLGDESFRRIAEAAEQVASSGRFEGLRLSAAGADSPTFKRFSARLAESVGLRPDQENGEFLVRVRPQQDGRGWEVLIRLTPRPASARGWRVCNRAGGLNAAVAAGMNELVGLRASDAYLNLMCGSGTLLIERALAAPAKRMVGFDVDAAAVACAVRNAEAAGVAGRCDIRLGDVTDGGFMALLTEAGPFDALTVDAPWGDAVGAHVANRRLYPQLLDAAAEAARPGARLCLLSHEVKLSRAVVAQHPAWKVTRELQVAHGGHNPLLLLLVREPVRR